VFLSSCYFVGFKIFGFLKSKFKNGGRQKKIQKSATTISIHQPCMVQENEPTHINGWTKFGGNDDDKECAKKSEKKEGGLFSFFIANQRESLIDWKSLWMHDGMSTFIYICSKPQHAAAFFEKAKTIKFGGFSTSADTWRAQ
jgi:hypothetical protein